MSFVTLESEFWLLLNFNLRSMQVLSFYVIYQCYMQSTRSNNLDFPGILKSIKFNNLITENKK